MKWKPVVFSADCDEDGNCPHCGIDYGDCDCPGPTQDGYEYKTIKGKLMARATDEELIKRIAEVRSLNNDLWMELLQIAIESEPNLTKDVLRQINANDRTVSDLLTELAK